MNMAIYLTNEELIEELNKSVEKPTEKLHLMFYEIAKNVAKRPNFRGYTYKEDMVHEAYLKCVNNYKKFKPGKNAFAFFTTIIFNEMIDFIKKEHKEHDLKQKVFEAWENDELEENTLVDNI